LAKSYEPAIDSVRQLTSRLVWWFWVGAVLEILGLVLFGLAAFVGQVALG